MKSSAAFSIHPKALRRFRAAVKQNGTTERPAAEALLLACLAAQPKRKQHLKSTLVSIL